MKKNAAIKYLFFKAAQSISPCPSHLNSACQLQVHGHLLADIFPQLWLLPVPFVLHRGAKISFLNRSTFSKTRNTLLIYFFKDTAEKKKRERKCEFTATARFCTLCQRYLKCTTVLLFNLEIRYLLWKEATSHKQALQGTVLRTRGIYHTCCTAVTLQYVKSRI